MVLQVIIGRFQLNNLHEGHLDMIRQVKARGEDVLILLGCTDATGTDKNPLSFEVRKHLFGSHFNITTPILPLYDTASNKDWSNQIDKIIRDLGYTEATIWGGRDNSIEGYYSGKHKIEVIPQLGNHSATTIRKSLSKETINCPNFRSGIIHHIENRYPIVYSTVDIILWRHTGQHEILVGRKGEEYSFIGGFVDTTDNSLYDAAKRELEEETGIKKELLCYWDSRKIKSRRYDYTKDSIMTHIFMGIHNDLPDPNKIVDKEFLDFKFITEDQISIMEESHRNMAIDFFKLNK